MRPAFDRLARMAREAGFDFAGLAAAVASPRSGAFRAWLDGGFHAGMGWLARAPERRCDPRRVWPEARSLLVAGVSCHSEEPPPSLWSDPTRGRIARYAWGPDYHAVVGTRLSALAGAIRLEAGLPEAPPSFVDTRPVLERDAADRAGLGFIGRNAMFVHPGFGSWVMLGGIALPWELDAPAPALPPGTGCGRCRRCRPACVAGALTADRVVDARRCASYLTIEHRGAVPAELCGGVGRWVFGCDACQEACPWNRVRARPASVPYLRFDSALHAPPLDELIRLDETGFRDRYAGTPLERAGRARLVRNAVIALSNSGHPDAAALLRATLADPDETVRRQAEVCLAPG